MVSRCRKKPAVAHRAVGRRQVLAVSKRLDRQLERAQVGKLRDNLVRPQTRLVYDRALQWFFKTLSEQGLSLPMHEDDLDDLVCDVTEYACENGEQRALVGNILSALPLHVNALHGKLKGAWTLWRLWGEREIPCRAPPLWQDGASAIANYFRKRTYINKSLLVMLAFHGFL